MKLSGHQQYVMDVLRSGGKIWKIDQPNPPDVYILSGNIHNPHISQYILPATVQRLMKSGLIMHTACNDGIHSACYSENNP